MKKLTTLLLLITLCYVATAQSDLKKKIVDSTCACLSAMPNLEKKSQQEIEIAVGQCMMSKSMEDFMALAQERNVEMTDEEGMKKLGMEIGMELVKSNCKAMTNLMLKMAEQNPTSISKENITVDEKSLTGAVQNIEVKDFVYITVLSNATAVQLVWSDMVENGNDFAKNLSSLKNKNLSFFYKEKKIYSIKDKAYIPVKMIERINILEAKTNH